MGTWLQIIQKYIKDNKIDKNIGSLLTLTAKAADGMKEKFLEYKLGDLTNYCISEPNNRKVIMYDERKDALFPGYTTEDWLRFLQIPEIADERTQRQQIMNHINKGAALTSAVQSGTLKDLKLVGDINKRSSNLDQPTFVYMNSESLFSETKKRLFQKCPSCSHIFLTEQTIRLGELEYQD